MSTEDLTLTDFNNVELLEDLEFKELFSEDPVNLKADEDSLSFYSTPSGPGRSKTSLTTAKKYLASWLKSIDAFYCSVTLAPICKTRVVQIAHVLLPQCATAEAVTIIGHSLAMKQAEMCLHSRVFLMALRSDVHSLVIMYRTFWLPSIEIMRLLEKYLRQFMAWSENGEDDSSPWSQLRKGTLKGYEVLRDGQRHDYTFLCSPHFQDQPPLNHGQVLFTRPYTDFPPIRSHVSPFAVCINTLRALECFDNPMVCDVINVYRHRTVDDFDNIQNWIELALQGMATGDTKTEVPPEVRERATAFTKFVKALDATQVYHSKRDDLSSASHRSFSRRGSIPESESDRSQRSHFSRSVNNAVTQPSSSTSALQVQEQYLAAHPPSIIATDSPPTVTTTATRLFLPESLRKLFRGRARRADGPSSEAREPQPAL